MVQNDENFVSSSHGFNLCTLLLFIKQKDVATKFGSSNIQNCTLNMNMFAYGIKINVIDGYCKLGSNTIMESMKWFV